MIYFDNCASTKPYDEVVKVVSEVMQDEYANSSALHRFGFRSEKIIRDAAKIIAESIGAEESEIIFTSGASESNNMSLFGVAKALRRRGNHIITTSIEHPAVRKVCDSLEEMGYSITYLKVDDNGNIDLEQLKNSLTEETILVSIMAINNEVGTIFPITEIGKIIKEYNKNIVYHVDGVQIYMKYPVNMKYIDLFSVSAHKFHGPKGVGFLYKRNNINIPPMILGGSHQSGYRAGTMNTPLIAGMAKAIELRKDRLDKILYNVREVKQYFVDKIKEIDGVKVNTSGKSISDYVCSVLFKNIRSEVMLHALEDEDIFVSAGSSCSSHSKKISSVLMNIGLSKDEAESTIRFSFSEFNTKKEVDRLIEVLKNLVPILSKFVRR